MNTGGAITGDADRLIEHITHATLVDIAHRVAGNAPLLEQVAFTVVEIPDPDQYGVARLHLGRPATEIDEIVIAMPQRNRQRHAVDIA